LACISSEQEPEATPVGHTAEEEESKAAEKAKTKGPSQPKLPRGKRGKMKKMKKKYADQDEEERELRIQLLQVCSLYPPPPCLHTYTIVAVGRAQKERGEKD